MKLNYLSCRINFRQNASSNNEYKNLYKLVFESLLLELEILNESRTGYEGRTLSICFEDLLPSLRIGRQGFFEALEWLDKEGYIQYVKGINRYHAGYVVLLHLPEIKEKNNPEVVIMDSGSIAVSYRTATEPLQNCYETATGPLLQNPPPHPPIEVKNNINTSSQPAGARTREGQFIPSNITLEENEMADLIGAYGEEKTVKALMKVSQLKRKNGGRLDKSDFHNVVSWALQQVEVDERQAQTLGQQTPIRHSTGPIQPGSYLPRAKSRKPD